MAQKKAKRPTCYPNNSLSMYSDAMSSNPRQSDQDAPDSTDGPPPMPSERLLIEQLSDWLPKERYHSGIVVSSGRAQIADELVADAGIERIVAWYHDKFPASLAQQSVTAGVSVACQPDLPGFDPGGNSSSDNPVAPASAQFDIAVIATSKSDEAEMTRDIMQQATHILREGGRLAVSVDNPRDTWVHDQMKAVFRKVTRLPSKFGCIYVSRKTQPLKKLKDFWCQFPMRDENGRDLQVVTRPGVFSHRRLDPGARQLMRAVEIGERDLVVDYGCGAGVLSATVATQTRNTVHAIDSSTRAIQCTQKTAAVNGLENIQAIVNADGNLGLDDTVDLVLANPPYYGNDRISQHFVDSSIKALRSGGALLVVTKKPSWYREYFAGLMDDILTFDSGKYWVACGRKP